MPIIPYNGAQQIWFRRTSIGILNTHLEMAKIAQDAGLGV